MESTSAALSDPVTVNTADEQAQFVRQADLRGTLGTDRSGCIYLEVPDPLGPKVAVDLLWPPGTSARAASTGGIEIVTKDDRVAGRIGQRITVGGGSDRIAG